MDSVHYLKDDCIQVQPLQGVEDIEQLGALLIWCAPCVTTASRCSQPWLSKRHEILLSPVATRSNISSSTVAIHTGQTRTASSDTGLDQHTDQGRTEDECRTHTNPL